MKRIFPLLALLMSALTLSATPGALKGLFSVSYGTKVHFSQGNLQYRATTGTWRFAEQQTDVIGRDNKNASATYDGWIDLMPYGSSGVDNTLMPYSECKEWDDDIHHTNYDWGKYNAISNGGNKPGIWRTLSKNEFEYLISNRPNAHLLRSLASVNGQNGMILLPDDWQLPDGLTFTPLAENYTTNAYSTLQWNQLEDAGAVFLPAAGERLYSQQTDQYGYPTDKYAYEFSPYAAMYWTSSVDHTTYDKAQYFVFADNTYNNYNQGKFGVAWSIPSDYPFYAVRLVKDYSPTDIADEKPLTGRFSVAEDEQVNFSQGNLQYRAASQQWQFAEDQWDIIGADNEHASATYSGWIDLFGWGTSGFANKAPWMTSANEADYADGTTNDIAGTYFDWGRYNAIKNGGKAEGLWRTMTKAEWDYLLQTRPNADRLQGVATVAGKHGYVLLPDEWMLPDKMWFTPMATSFNINTYTARQWRTMEAAGAVFLPAAGSYDVSMPVMLSVTLNTQGYYWTSSSNTDNAQNAVVFMFGVVNSTVLNGMTADYDSRAEHNSVRLVRQATGEGIEDVQRDDVPCTKILRDGQILILRNGRMYDIKGLEIR